MEKTLLVLSIMLTLVWVACSKQAYSGETTLKVKLTDNPFNAEEINIDLKQVVVKYDNSDDDWATLTTTAGVYNLLEFQNGNDTLVATGRIPGNQVKEIRLILGENNSIMINGISSSLTIPSGSESGLKLKVDRAVNGNLDSLIVDFDAALSIHETGNGKFILKPVLRLK